MRAFPFILVVLFVALAVVACDQTRPQECARVLSTMKTLDDATPSADTVDTTLAAINAMQLQDEPLREYVTSAKKTLRALAATLHAQASPDAPDGTDELVKVKLKEARSDKGDIAHYCAQ